MTYIKNLRNLGKVECAKCRKRTPGTLADDVQCVHCGAAFDEDCYEPRSRELRSERRFLGRRRVIHVEFDCGKCGRNNAWHDCLATFLLFGHLAVRDCDCGNSAETPHLNTPS